MPAFKHNQRILLAVLERGHKAHGYVHSGTFVIDGRYSSVFIGISERRLQGIGFDFLSSSARSQSAPAAVAVVIAVAVTRPVAASASSVVTVTVVPVFDLH